MARKPIPKSEKRSVEKAVRFTKSEWKVAKCNIMKGESESDFIRRAVMAFVV